MLVRAALVLLLAPLCLCAGKEPQSEGRVYKTKEWKDSSKTLILTKQSSFDFMGYLISLYYCFFSYPGSVPVNFLKALLDATKNSNVTHIKVRILLNLKEII